MRLNPQGRVTEEWETLVHPGIPIPNSDVHGINDRLVAGAPRFAQIAGLLAAKLHEHVLVAHNLHHFDGPILEAHFTKVEGVDLSLGRGVDTMPRPMLKLAELCSRHGVQIEVGQAHTALGDTRALAKALQRGMAHLNPAEEMVVVHRNGLLNQPCSPITRSMATVKGGQTGWKPIDLRLEAWSDLSCDGPEVNQRKHRDQPRRSPRHQPRPHLSQGLSDQPQITAAVPAQHQSRSAQQEDGHGTRTTDPCGPLS